VRTSAWLPGGGFLLVLVLTGLLLVASDLDYSGPGGREWAEGGWVRLVCEDGPERFVRIRQGELLHGFLGREAPGLAGAVAACCPALPVTSGTEIRLSQVETGTGGEMACRVSPLPESVRYLLGMRMNVNRAEPDELAMLPGIGDVMARRIRQERERRNGFSCREDLLRVSGIGPKRLEKIERHLTFGP